MTRKEYLKKWNEDHKNEKRTYSKKYYAEHKAKLDDYTRCWKKAHPEATKAIAVRCYLNNISRHIRKRLKRLYGITPEQKQDVLRFQDYKCAACGSTEPGPKGWCWDHNHVTGFARGILCHSCNVALGMLNDSVERCEQLIAYLNFKPDYNFEVL